MLDKFSVRLFIIWRVAIFVFIFIGTLYVPLQQNHIGGGIKTYNENPLFWSMANFDGEHYMSIAAHGYKPLQHFFFPIYPMLVSLFSLSDTPFGLALTAQVISNVSLVFALVGLWKLIKLDYSAKISRYTLLFLLLFPTSFYFVAVYTESLFLAVIVWSFYFARKKNWLLACVLAGVASATRIIGLVMLPVILIEWHQSSKENRELKTLLLLPICLTGILAYMLFLYYQTNDFFAFKTSLQMVYGEQRSDTLVLLPQVLYRYIFKIFPNMNWLYLHGSFSLLLEFLSAMLFLVLTLYSAFKMRLSYAFYMAAGYVIPTLSGSFSSMGRYVLVLFPGFIIMAVLVSRMRKRFQYLTLGLMIVLLAVTTALFSRGYWIA